MELICDEIHVHPSVVRMVFSAFNKDRIVLISDSISATGIPDGSYTLGGLKTTVRNNISRMLLAARKNLRRNTSASM